MAGIWRIATVVLGPGLLLALVLIGYAAVDAYVLGNCDSKFGCAGGVQVAAFIAGLALLCSSAGNAVVSVLYRHAVRCTSLSWLVGAVAVLGIAQGALFLTVNRWPAESVIGMMVAWSCASAAIGWGVLAAAHRWAPNNSFKPNPLRGSA